MITINPNPIAPQRPSHDPSSHDLAAAYLKGITLEDRRQAGQVYTPLHLVHFILELAGYDPDLPIEHATLLDPACGGGVFLQVAVTHLAARLTGLGTDLGTQLGHDRLLELVSQNFFGVDLDANACALTGQAVREAIRCVSARPVSDDFFDTNVFQADFLRSDDLELRLPFGGLDFVVGNPPYVQTTRLEPEVKAELRARFVSASGRLDLYTLFIERTIPILRDGGRFAFITPDKFLASLSAADIRAVLVRNGSLKRVARFTSHKVFQDAATVPCVTVFERGAAHNQIEILQCGDQADHDGNVPVIERYALPGSRLRKPIWDFNPPDLRHLTERIQGQHRSLESVTARISAGVATGRNEVFVIPVNATVDLEPELLRRAVRGEDIGPYSINDPGLRLLIPYTYDDGQRRLIELSQYPLAQAYLERFKADLEKRQVVTVKNQAWYAFTDPSKVDLSRLPKILVPDVAEHNRFAFDPGNFFPLNSAYYLVPDGIDPHYLTAVLNSTPIEFLIRLHAPIAKDRFSRYRRQFLAPLPIPMPDLQTVQAIVEAALRGDARQTDALCTELFGLTDGELTMINAYLGRTQT